MRVAPLVLGVLGVGFVVALAPLASADGPGGCVKYWGEARFNGVGYNHLVYLANSCAAAATCAVSSDVNPEPQTVEVAGRGQAVVNTFLGSPARAFSPRVKCVMQE